MKIRPAVYLSPEGGEKLLLGCAAVALRALKR